MSSCSNCEAWACLQSGESLRLRLRTGQAMMLLCWSTTLVGWIPFAWWRRSLGMPTDGDPFERSGEAQRLGVHVQRAAELLPFHCKCLPQAMALSWLLRRNRIAHAVVIAVRPTGHRESVDRLHAWVEVHGAVVLGDLPGPWIETLRLGA